MSIASDFSTDIFRHRFHGIVIYFLQFRLQIFRRHARIFSHFFLCCSYFLFEVRVSFFQLAFYSDTHYSKVNDYLAFITK